MLFIAYPLATAIITLIDMGIDKLVRLISSKISNNRNKEPIAE